MRVQSLELHQFRNFTNLQLTCPEELHLFVGSNAQGKTNILESLYVLSLGKSHRSRSHKELIQFGKQTAYLKARIQQSETNHRLEVRLSERGKKVSKNGVEKARLSEYIGGLPTVLFAPEDLAIIKGGPQIRRRFLDLEIGQVNPNYVYDLSSLQKVLQQRNRLLKESTAKHYDDQLLEVIDEQLLALSVRIWRKRVQFLSLLEPWANEIHHSITQSNEPLRIIYTPSLPDADQMEDEELLSRFRQRLLGQRSLELRRGNTLIGPHRDDFQLVHGEINLHVYGSQGQQRTAALSLKLAEIELIGHMTGHYPILLLDDVLSELDDSRKTHLLSAIHGKVQTFVTATGLEGIGNSLLKRAKIYHVKQGMITEQR